MFDLVDLLAVESGMLTPYHYKYYPDQTNDELWKFHTLIFSLIFVSHILMVYLRLKVMNIQTFIQEQNQRCVNVTLPHINEIRRHL